MRLRREQIVFLVTLAVLALLAWSSDIGKSPRGGGRRGKAPEFEEYAVPDLARVLPDGAPVRPLNRGLFEEPRDTRPLPPLEFQEPPFPALAGIFPPPEPGPVPALFGRTLRRDAAVNWVPGLFTARGDELGAELEGFEFDEGGEFDGQRPGTGESTGTSGSTTGDGTASYGFETRVALEESYKRLYDWIQTGPGQVLFGSIRNEDRFTLHRPSRIDEPILFLILDPETGSTRYTPDPIEYTRDRIEADGTAWGLADTVSNRLERRYSDLSTNLNEGNLPALLDFASDCVNARLEAPRALELAEEIYLAVAEVEASSGRRSHAARLGLGRCLEAGFEFERAFAQYEALLEEFPLEADVHVALARLERRFLMEESAEARLRRALAIERTSFDARRSLAELLIDQGRYTEALEHLDWANRSAPEDPGRLVDRAAVRTLLGDAHTALGDFPAALTAYGNALTVDPTYGPMLAGLDALELLGVPGVAAAKERAASRARAEDASTTSAGFRQLLNEGLLALADGRSAEARELLLAAADEDPLRAGRAWRALSWLAETTGHDGHAMVFVEEALGNDPTDVWALFQRGRLLVQLDAVEEARASFRAALEGELELVDALLALGLLDHGEGRWEDAQRYLERALLLEPDHLPALLLRGLNEVQAGAVLAARATFEEAVALDPTNPTAAAGLAWCTYRLGDPGEAITLLARIDDNRRDQPEDDPYRVWSRAQIARIQDHLDKAAWSDHFERRTLQNGWFVDEADGPLHTLSDGALKFEGTFRTGGRVRVYREIRSNQFVSFEASVKVDPSTAARVGVFIAREKQRTRQAETLSEASVSRHRDGQPEARFVQRSQSEPELVAVEAPFPAGEWVRIRIERTGEASDARVTLYLDGVPVVEGEPMSDLGRTNTPLYAGFFAEGENGRPLLTWMDDVEMVFRKGL